MHNRIEKLNNKNREKNISADQPNLQMGQLLVFPRPAVQQARPINQAALPHDTASQLDRHAQKAAVKTTIMAGWRSMLPALLLMLIAIPVIAVVVPQDFGVSAVSGTDQIAAAIERGYLLVYPPAYSLDQIVTDLAAHGGRLISVGAFENIVLADFTDQQGQVATTVFSDEAWFHLRSRFLASCLIEKSTGA